MQFRDALVALACCCIAIGATAMGKAAGYVFPGHDLALSIAGPALIIFGIIAGTAGLVSAALERPADDIYLAQAEVGEVEDSIEKNRRCGDASGDVT